MIRHGAAGAGKKTDMSRLATWTHPYFKLAPVAQVVKQKLQQHTLSMSLMSLSHTHSHCLSVSMARTGANNKCIRKLTYKFMNDIVNVMSTST